MSRKECGSCTACCSTVPVPEIQLRAFETCRHVQRPPAATVGCGIYPNRPRSCRLWNCQWLVELGWSDDLRPDRCGVVVDIMPDTFGLLDETTGKVIEKVAMQFWAARDREDEWRNPDSPVQDLIGSVLATGMAVLWRIYDPGPSGQAVQAFWLDEKGQRVTCAGGPPVRQRTDRQRYEDAAAMLARMGRPIEPVFTGHEE